MARNPNPGPLTIVLLLAAWTLAVAQTPGRPVRAVTTSGQFVVYSKEAEWRSVVSRRAEAAREAWDRWLGNPGRSQQPIIIQDLRGQARPRGNPRAVTAVYEGDGGLPKVQLDVYDASLLSGEDFEAELFRALALDLTYRGKTLRAGKSFRLAPDWVVEGMAEEFRVRRGGPPDGVYAALLRSDRPPKLEDFLRSRPAGMSATTMTIFRTQALALLRALEQTRERGTGLGRFLASLDEGEASLKSLLAAFPSLDGNAGTLERLWTLAIARGTAARNVDALSVAETNRRLDEILDVTAFKDPRRPEEGTVGGAEALPLIARSEGGPFIMRQKAAEMLALEMRAHPAMRPVISEFRAAAELLAEKPRRNVQKRLEEAAKIRDLLGQRTGGVGDYLNWFEATQLDTLSGDFLEITNPPEAPKRTDPLTEHLDAIERRGW
ncbi:MAG: hypothetical protein SFU53_05305 [Terrimicrobiaceae bacterium]|nr:hypothetical protein [Terrimicrobiaceae bacterium]